MSEVDEIRALLDERGAEYREVEVSGVHMFRLGYSRYCDDFLSEITVTGACISATSSYLTPGRAVEAVLGRGECMRVMDSIDPLGMWVCDHCGHPLNTSENFCGGCGRQVKR